MQCFHYAFGHGEAEIDHFPMIPLKQIINLLFHRGCGLWINTVSKKILVHNLIFFFFELFTDQSIEYFVMHSILTYIGQVDVRYATIIQFFSN